MNVVLHFAINGTAHCLWTEAVPLHQLGRLETHRATNIEFNNATQHWEVKDQKRSVRFFGGTRHTGPATEATAARVNTARNALKQQA